MVIGTVNANLEATIPLTALGPAGQSMEIEVVLDTGFSASLSLPPNIIAHLALVQHGRRTAILANGSVEHFDTYWAAVIWDGLRRRVRATAADTDALLGTKLLAGHEVRIQAIVRGIVTIEALP
jgi:clan AA aspartic protease